MFTNRKQLHQNHLVQSQSVFATVLNHQHLLLPSSRSTQPSKSQLYFRSTTSRFHLCRLPHVTAATTLQPSYTSAVKQFHSAKPEPVLFQIDDQSFPPLPSATLLHVTAATTSQPSYTSAVKQFHLAKPEPVVFQIDDQSFPPLSSATLPHVTAATTSQPSVYVRSFPFLSSFTHFF
jgi:hypothetical protein